MAGSERKRSRRNSRIEVCAYWQHTKAVSPAFVRLMALLLQERTGNEENTRRESDRPDHSVL